MKTIPLTQGQFAIVDDADFDWLMQWKWHFNGGYAKRAERLESGEIRLVWMHRLINGTPEGRDTDHKNCNRLDNRRDNLRVATRAQNHYNKSLGSDNTSGFKGVSWEKRRGKWIASINIDGHRKFLGSFISAEIAYSAYCEAARLGHGEFARTE